MEEESNEINVASATPLSLPQPTARNARLAHGSYSHKPSLVDINNLLDSRSPDKASGFNAMKVLAAASKSNAPNDVGGAAGKSNPNAVGSAGVAEHFEPQVNFLAKVRGRISSCSAGVASRIESFLPCHVRVFRNGTVSRTDRLT